MATVIDQNEMFGTTFEPILKNRYLMYIDGIPAFTIKSIQLPSIQFEDIVLDHINVKRKYKGKGEWQDINITLYSPIVPSAAQAVMEWIRLAHESVTGREGYSDVYKKDVSINVLGPAGDVVQEWTLKGAYVKSAAFGDMAWGESAFAEIAVTIRMDYAILQY